MAASTASESPLPRSPKLRWLMDAGPGVPMPIRTKLLDEMVGSPAASVSGPLSAVLIEAVALGMGAGSAFLWLLGLELLLLAARLAILSRIARNRAKATATPPDPYFVLAIAWCALQGALACACLLTRQPALMVLAAANMMALVGPICARNFGAPRYAMLLLSLILLPMLAGAQFCGQPWLRAMLLQAPLLFIGAGTILRRYQTLALTALLGEASSQHRALHDGLTGLLNRAGLEEVLAEILAEAPAGPGGQRPPFALCYLDLDGFKPVNDSFGHAAGDAVLVEVADRSRRGGREHDRFARVGGDEFVVVLLNTAPAEAEQITERLIRRISARPYAMRGGGSIPIGVSAGIACAPADGEDIVELQRRADTALYEAKGAGRGMWRRFMDPESPASFSEGGYEIPLSPAAYKIGLDPVASNFPTRTFFDS